MKHLLYSQEQNQPIKWFEKFDKEEIKTEVVNWLKDNPTDTLEHCKKDLRKYAGNEIINFYENKNAVPCLVVLRGTKEYYKPLDN